MPRLSALLAVTVLFPLAARADEAPKPKPPSTEEQLVAGLASAKWVPAPTPGLPKGAQVSAIGVDPATGGSTAYARLPPGYRLPMHFHSHAEYTAIIAGKGTFTLDGKLHEVQAGSYLVIPAKVHHALVCAAGTECVLLTRRAGPTDYNFVTP